LVRTLDIQSISTEFWHNLSVVESLLIFKSSFFYYRGMKETL